MQHLDMTIHTTSAPPAGSRSTLNVTAKCDNLEGILDDIVTSLLLTGRAWHEMNPNNSRNNGNNAAVKHVGSPA